MKKEIVLICLCIAFQVTQYEMKAQNTAVYEGLTYYMDKKEAFEAATAQGKQVLLFWGSDACSRCNQVKKNLAHSSMASLLENNYILWYCKTVAGSTVNSQDSPDVADYLANLIVSFPTLCVINTTDKKTAHGLVTGRIVGVDELRTMLTQYQDVKNSFVVDTENESVTVYTNDKSLIIKNNILNEIVSIYTIGGSAVDRFVKTDQSVARNLSTYPKGILFVTSSSGWARKVVIK